ncbi:MAG: Holliday junction resolvasome RuvABC DNA-binding subunit [Lentimonas sp.]|jgi:Holliday junction resolvasome RuvABC DNA-binding subunit
MSTPITDIIGIGPATAAALSKNGFHTAADIAAADVNALCAMPGFGPIKAKATISAATAMAATETSKPEKTKKATPKSKKQRKSKKDAKLTKSGKKKKNKKSDKKSKAKKK